MNDDSKTTKAGSWSFADQGTVSLGNFLTSVLLARFLAPADYGIFVLIYGVLVVLNSFHSCAVVYPLSLLGAPGTIQDLQRRVGRSLYLTLIVAIPLCVLVCVATIVLGRPDLALWACLAIVCWQIQEVLRRGLMAHLRHAQAIWGDASSYLGQAALILIVVREGHNSLETVFGILAATSLFACVIQTRQLNLRPQCELPQARDFKSSWQFSRWAILANIAVAIPAVAFPWFLAIKGTYLAGSYQALLNIVGISNAIMLSVGNVALPAASRANAVGGWKSSARTVLRYALLGAALLVPCFLLIFTKPVVVLRLVYSSNSVYLAQANSLRLLVAAYALGYVAYLLAVLFYGVGLSKRVLYAQSVAALAACVFGLPLITVFGIPGACAGVLATNLVQVLVFTFFVPESRHVPVLAKMHDRLGTATESKAVEFEDFRQDASVATPSRTDSIPG